MLGDVRMPKGTLVTIGIGAANRDPEPFPDPDRFDVARNPTRHLAFGSGIHMCAGMSLGATRGPRRDRAISPAVSGLPGRRRPGRSRRARFRGFTVLPVRLT